MVVVPFRRALLAGLGVLLVAPPVEAYVGPGAGFALLSSFLVVFTTIVLAFVSLLVWPFRLALRAMKGGTRPTPLIKRLVIVGLDGQDPVLTDRFLKEGKLPHFAKLARMGGYRRLRTTFPSVSPVAWSTFSTGVHPARHNIFDFLDRDRRTYLPVLSSTHIGPATRQLKLGRFRIPLGRPDLRLLRRSKPFWSILGEHRIWSTILRVPITFPPDRFYGAELSAMCVPDLQGTQGTFTLLTTRPPRERFKEGGTRVELRRNGTGLSAEIEGPPNAFVDDAPPLVLPLTIRPDADGRRARVEVDGQAHMLDVGTLSDWITLGFKAAPLVTVSGLCRMQLLEAGEHVSLYVTPISIDPEQPAMPISHPSYYATYLAKRIGPYSTLGLAEDTWALNEGVTDDGTFLKQTYDIDAERERMFFAALDRLRRGALVCVFDATDRIQHMFWRYLEPGHPAGGGRDTAEHRDAIERLYVHNDALVGRVMARLDEGDVLMVLSDHGFTSFRRGVNLNAWLLVNGYLALKPGTDGSAEWLRDVDWSRTRAYALGLTGLFLNVRGREAQGIVEPGDGVAALKRELVERLTGLPDEACGTVAITEAFDTASLYAGPYLENAPDLLIGYNRGYRTSWDCATGVVAGPLCEDNVKAWSGDHCVDPRQVPGVLFANRPVDSADPALIDIAPTALHLFGIEPPRHMEGTVIMQGVSGASAGVPDAIDPAPTAAEAAASRDAGARPAKAPGRKGKKKRR
jgi:predicted AlkP superfamily phosphohydrolase/phosphomutase